MEFCVKPRASGARLFSCPKRDRLSKSDFRYLPKSDHPYLTAVNDLLTINMWKNVEAAITFWQSYPTFNQLKSVTDIKNVFF